jgi:hypothetical protein
VEILRFAALKMLNPAHGSSLPVLRERARVRVLVIREVVTKSAEPSP